ncbi:MAG: PH domain-containing protein [Streptosporangiales bacterium]|nr:PH domain-containing protein [Streptosporangiales bacterium]
MAKVDRRLAPGEQIYHQLHPHWQVLVGPVFLFLVCVGAGGFLAAVLPETWMRAAIAVICLLVVLLWVLRPFLRWYTTTYTLTDRRVLIREGIFTRSGRDIPLARVTDVAFRHTLWQRMLRTGTLILESAGEQGQAVLTNVPSVETVQRDIYTLLDPAALDSDADEEESY